MCGRMRVRVVVCKRARAYPPLSVSECLCRYPCTLMCQRTRILALILMMITCCHRYSRSHVNNENIKAAKPISCKIRLRAAHEHARKHVRTHTGILSLHSRRCQPAKARAVIPRHTAGTLTFQLSGLRRSARALYTLTRAP